MKKLEGREVILPHSIGKKVNEIIEALEEAGIIDKEKAKDEIFKE